MRLYFMVVRRVPPVPSPVLAEVYGILEGRGYRVDAGIAEEQLIRSDLAEPRHDLYVIKSHTDLTLSLAGALHTQAARTLNPYPNCLEAQDKIVASRRLRAAGVPSPATWVTADLPLLREAVGRIPLIIKPHRGHRGQGIHIVRNEAELEAIPPPSWPIVAQEYVEGSGEDLKVYVVGERVFAVRKPFSPDSFTRPGRPCEVSEEVRDIALRCGEAFGLGLFGLDMIEGKDGPVVVDVNYFPGYKGVPGVAPAIADYVDGFAAGLFGLRLPEMAGFGLGPERVMS